MREGLVYINHSMEATASPGLQMVYPDPLFNSSANAAPVSAQALPVQCYYSTGTDVDCGGLETTA